MAKTRQWIGASDDCQLEAGQHQGQHQAELNDILLPRKKNVWIQIRNAQRSPASFTNCSDCLHLRVTHFKCCTTQRQLETLFLRALLISDHTRLHSYNDNERRTFIRQRASSTCTFNERLKNCESLVATRVPEVCPTQTFAAAFTCPSLSNGYRPSNFLQASVHQPVECEEKRLTLFLRLL